MANERIRAYQQAQTANLSGRELEAMAFTKAALKLEDAKKLTENPTEFGKALRFNHLLWTIIQADIVEPSNMLPPEIKANIMSLSIFVDKQTAKALRTRNAADLEVLVNINRNLAAGLRTAPEKPDAD
ncbi:flagellar biosynthesis regulator FlaF [Oleispirillum naphthae]|uniref:flagellar biosynthesis regulator FlaF n=1 Tax=Oleispirillum naphthae TaxID=2838853 RepID=UPI003082541E